MLNPLKTTLIVSAMVGMVSLLGCSPQNDPVATADGEAIVFSNEYRTIKIEGCEYIYMGSTNSQTITHKGNCNNPIHTPNTKEQ